VLRQLLISLTACAGIAAAQTPTVPAEYQGLYNELQAKLNAFDSAVSAQWNGTQYSTLFSGELLTVNSNRGLQLLGSNVRTGYLTELAALKKVGAQAVVVKMGYPLLYEPFMQFNGTPDDYSKIVAFFQQVVKDVHDAGMKVIVESDTLFPGFYSSGSGMNLAGYYKSIDYQQFLDGEATVAQTIVEQIGPDYVDVGSEPDTMAKLTGFTELLNPTNWAAAVNAFMSKIPPSANVKVGAGIGTWLGKNGSEFVQQLLDNTNVDYIDLHIYPLNTPPGSGKPIWQNALDLVNLVESQGRDVAFSEAWLLKTSDADFQEANAGSDPTAFSRDAYSFWQPLDQQFLNIMFKLANSRQFLYFSPFWTGYYWSYVDYDQVQGQTPEQLTLTSELASAQALQAGQTSSTGNKFQALNQDNIAKRVAIISNATFRNGAVAPETIVAIFGANLTSNSGSGPPSASLAGTSVNVQDSSGNPQAAQLLYVSPSQIIAILPSNMAQGNATATITSGGSTVKGSFLVGPINPGLFSKNSSGGGVPAAEVWTQHSDGTVSKGFAYSDSAPYGTKPINVSNPGDTVYLILYGTGLGNADSGITVTLGDQRLTPGYAGRQKQFPGLDQVNVILPASLAGSGVQNLTLTTKDGRSNTVQIEIQ
jgi:uncharacterized protein (TIGR03437 family)